MLLTNMGLFQEYYLQKIIGKIFVLSLNLGDFFYFGMTIQIAKKGIKIRVKIWFK